MRNTLMDYRSGRHFLQIPGPTNVPDRVLRAIDAPVIDHRGPAFARLGLHVLEGLKALFKTSSPVIIYPASGTGAWEAALVNTLSPGDKVLMAETGWFATLWQKMAKRLGVEPIFIKGAKVKHLYVDGREVRLPADTPRRGNGEAASPIDGTWHFTVKTPQGDVSIGATLLADAGNITGTFSGDHGSGDIRSGRIDGSTVEFTIAIRTQPQGEGETGDWVFHGTLRDATLEGTVSTTLGTFPFTGSKSR